MLWTVCLVNHLVVVYWTMCILSVIFALVEEWGVVEVFSLMGDLHVVGHHALQDVVRLVDQMVSLLVLLIDPVNSSPLSGLSHFEVRPFLLLSNYAEI